MNQLIIEKIRQAKRILRKFDIDCWITFARESQINGDPTLAFLVTGDITWHSAFIISSDGKAHAIVGLYDQKTVEETGAYDEVEGFVEGINASLGAYLKKLNPSKIALNYSEGSEICDGLTYGMYLTLHKLLEELGFEQRIVCAEKIVSALRERKTPSELVNITRAVRYTEEIFDLVRQFIKPGVTELEIAAYMKKEVKNRALELAWEEASCPAVFTGPDGADAHYAPTNKKVKQGHILNIDFGVKYEGYCSDMQRTFYILQNGESAAPNDVQKGFDTIVNAVDYSKVGIMPGKTGEEIDKIARDIVVAGGYEAFPHGLGHQVGRFSHDGTALLGPAWEKYAEKPFRKLEENMVFTIEPRLTVPGRGVVTIEEMIVIKKFGAEYLSSPQKELILI